MMTAIAITLYKFLLMTAIAIPIKANNYLNSHSVFGHPGNISYNK